MDLCWQNDVSAFNMLSRFVIAFLPRSKSLHFVAAVTICSDSGAQEKKICHCFPFYSPWSDGTGCLDLRFFEYWVLSQLFHSPLSPSSRDSLVLLHFLPLDWYFCISEIVDISPAILIPACASSTPAFLMMYSACKLSKRGNNIQPWHTSFPILNQSIVPCLILTCFLTCIHVSQETGEVVWCGG